MTVFEYEDSIIIVDAGIMFPENDMLGIDTIIPDYKYLEDKFENIEAVLVTHGHEDHIGAVPYLWRRFRKPIYATAFTMELVKRKLAEVGLSKFDSDRLSSEYSGGMKRRLSLACATIGQPQIVFRWRSNASRGRLFVKMLPLLFADATASITIWSDK